MTYPIPREQSDMAKVHARKEVRNGARKTDRTRL